MGDFGKYTPIAWINGGPPCIDADNLLSHEDVLSLTDEELRRSQCLNFEKSKLKEYFWQRCTKEICNFTSGDEWTASTASTDISDDTTNNMIGSNSVRFTEHDDNAGWLGIYKDIPSIDLSVFNDGQASSVSDFIYLIFYITDTTKFNVFQFKFGDDNANNYNYAVAAAGFSNGYNYLAAAKSAFAITGAPAGWDDITHIRIEATSLANAQDEYITCDYLQMVKEDSLFGGWPNSFQEYMGLATGWENKFDIILDILSVVYDEKLNRHGIMLMPPEPTGSVLHIYCSVLSFIAYIEMYCKYEDYSLGLSWEVDSDNLIETYVNNGTFYLSVTEAGVTTNVTVVLSNTLLKDERIIIKLEKDNDTCRAILYKDGEMMHVLEYETSIAADSVGCVYIQSSSANAWSLVTDFAISSNYGDLNLYNEWSKGPKLYKLFTTQSYTSNVLTNIDDFFIKLPANRTFRIEAFFSIQNTGSATPDFRVDWESSGVTALSNRVSVGGVAVSAATEPSSTNNVRTSVHGLTTDIRYALSAISTSSAATENFIVETGNDGGYLQCRGAQYNTDAGNPTDLTTSSCVVVTEVFQ